MQLLSNPDSIFQLSRCLLEGVSVENEPTLGEVALERELDRRS